MKIEALHALAGGFEVFVDNKYYGHIAKAEDLPTAEEAEDFLIDQEYADKAAASGNPSIADLAESVKAARKEAVK